MGRYRMSCCRGLFVAMVLAAMSSTACADDAKVVYYNVAGDSVRALRQQLDAEGPMDASGKRFDAYTTWYVKWRYRYQATASGCELTQVDVSLSGTMILPRWVGMDHAPRALVQQWDEYIAALRLHEQGHYAHGAAAAAAIEALAQSFHDSGDCPAMTEAFNARAHSIIDQYKALDATYDRETGHGRTQGAHFP